MSFYGLLEIFGRDVRFALRMFRRSPGFSLVAVVTVGLAVGVSTAVFGVVKAVLLNPLPYGESDRIVVIEEPTAGEPDNRSIPYTLMREIATRSHSLASVSAYEDSAAVLVENGHAEMLRGLNVDSNFFETLDAPVELGRRFVASDQRPKRRNSAIIAHSLWMRRFGGDPAIVGRQLDLDGGPVEVLGVLPSWFQPLLKAQSSSVPELYFTQPADPHASCQDCQYLRFIGRLNSGVTIAQATADLNRKLAVLVSGSPDLYPSGASLKLTALSDRLLGHVNAALWSVWWGADCLLLIACANVASLLLTRAASRTREIAIRSAIGAARHRLMCQLLTESLLLASGGGLLGIALSYVLTAAFALLAPEGIPRAESVGVDGTVLGVGIASTLVAGLLFGMGPALNASRVDLARAAGRDGSTQRRWRNAIMVAEIALAFVLVVGAGLMGRTFQRLVTIGAGFNPDNVLTLTTNVGNSHYSKNLIGYYREVLEKLRATPGVESAAMTNLLPMDYTVQRTLAISERSDPNESEQARAELFSVSTDYFEVMRIPLLRGRRFTELDDAGAPRVALINNALAHFRFPLEDPIGKHVQVGDTPWMTVIGVVGDVHQDGIDRPSDLQVYMPLNQKAVIDYYRLVARTTIKPLSAERAIRRVFETVDPGSPVYHVKPLISYYFERLANRTCALTLFSLLAVIAMALAAVGIYGVVSYSLAQQIKEIGIRIAVGATALHIFIRYLQQVLPLIVAGLVIGSLASLSLSHLISNLLFEVAPTDPLTFAAVSVLLGTVALAAAALPVRRAASVDPITSLRSE